MISFCYVWRETSNADGLQNYLARRGSTWLSAEEYCNVYSRYFLIASGYNWRAVALVNKRIYKIATLLFRSADNVCFISTVFL